MQPCQVLTIAPATTGCSRDGGRRMEGAGERAMTLVLGIIQRNTTVCQSTPAENAFALACRKPSPTKYFLQQ